MDVVVYFKNKKRMTDSCRTCAACPFSNIKNGKEESCCNYEELYPEEAVRIVEEWSKEHPIQENGQKFKEVFGFDPWRVVTGDEESWDIVFNDNLTQLNFWRSPYEAPKGSDK